MDIDYRKIIESKYNRQNWQLLLRDIFKSRVEFWATPYEISTNSSMAKQALWLGTITLSDNETIAIYEVELSDSVDIERNRRGIRDMLLTEWRNRDAGAFMFCYRKNESVLRFSYVSETWGFNKQGVYEKVSTDTKRYTYLLGENRGCRTAINQFTKLKESKLTLSDITTAFSVEALTKQFYKDLFEWFQWAIEPSSNVSFPNDTTFEDDDRDDIEKKMIRLITRIMFVWFIKQKDLVPHRIFDAEFLSSILKDFNPVSATNGNYYNAILQNLFFATLNREIVDEEGNRRRFAKGAKKDIKNLYRYAELFSISENEVIDLFSEVPFLNGGLFECLDKTKTIDGVERAYNLDGFSRNNTTFLDGRYCHRAIIPNILFFEPEKGIISILSRYNFTIEENSPEEQQVALDPELLGKVFENLLGAYNPETKETARNQSGSFYTPREIVNYMVDESLIAYLGDTPFVRSIFSSHFEAEKDKANEYHQIADKLKAVKVIDPACGSGAFPMGLLNRMVDIIQKISPDENTYDLKLNIIENCIYGSDIQSIATQISKLRFFISLICDCEKDASKPNFGIPTLPNLETKFVAANSLIDRKNKGKYVQGNLFIDSAVMDLKDQLRKCRHEHFKADTASKKIRLRKEDAKLRKELIELLSQGFGSELGADQLAAWNPYDQNAVSPFFDPEWMFGITDGFDIVIGNPPYIQLQAEKGKLAKLYAPCEYETFNRGGDIFCLFYERGNQILKDKGFLCYITSNKWMRAGYGAELRGYLTTKTNPRLLIDFGETHVFESATVMTNILIFQKTENKYKIKSTQIKGDFKDPSTLIDYVENNHIICSFERCESWVILPEKIRNLKKIVETQGTPLENWDIEINYGIKTGYNPAFIIDTNTRDVILADCKNENEIVRTKELIRPMLRGKDVLKYGFQWNKWLIGTFPSRKLNIDDYPAVKKYMLSFTIERLEQTGKKHVVNGEEIKSRKKSSGKWFETQDSISYWQDFDKPKIVYPNMTKYLPFYYDEQKFFTNQKCFIITGTHMSYLTAFLNSSLFKFCFFDNFPVLFGGSRELSKIFFDKIPVLDVDDATDAEFREYVLDIQKEYSEEKAKAIDQRIFDLYGLTQEERDIIGYIDFHNDGGEEDSDEE